MQDYYGHATLALPYKNDFKYEKLFSNITANCLWKYSVFGACKNARPQVDSILLMRLIMKNWDCDMQFIGV
jgi:hypothetical protein